MNNNCISFSFLLKTHYINAWNPEFQMKCLSFLGPWLSALLYYSCIPTCETVLFGTVRDRSVPPYLYGCGFASSFGVYLIHLIVHPYPASPTAALIFLLRLPACLLFIPALLWIPTTVRKSVSI